MSDSRIRGNLRRVVLGKKTGAYKFEKRRKELKKKKKKEEKMRRRQGKDDVPGEPEPSGGPLPE